MRHRKFSQRLSRNTGQRKALLRSLAISLLKYQKIKTTKAKARMVQPLVGRLISLGKQNTLQSRRLAFKILSDKIAVGRLFSQIATLFKEKNSGFSRVVRYLHRRGDGAEMVFLELTEKLPEVKPVKPTKVKPVQKEVPSEKPQKPTAEIKREKETTLSKEKLRPAKKLKPKKFLGGLRKLFKKERDSL